MKFRQLFSFDRSSLPEWQVFLEDCGMSMAGLPHPKTPQVLRCDEDLTYAVLAGPARRKLLVALAKDGPQIGAAMTTIGRAFAKASTESNFLRSTLKNLEPMVKAGMVVRSANPGDGRRPLYSLSPAVKVSTEGEQTVFDFGFCVVRLGADGN